MISGSCSEHLHIDFESFFPKQRMLEGVHGRRKGGEGVPSWAGLVVKNAGQRVRRSAGGSADPYVAK